jgi:hypothetical protein
LKTYKSLQIRDVILNCGLGYREFYAYGDKIRYYSSPNNNFVELKMYETYIEDEIELLIEQIGISLEEFNRLYKLAKKHEL